MIGSFTEAARLPQTDRDQAALIGDTEGQVAVALLRQIRGNDWQRPTDCPEWDVRALVSHLVPSAKTAFASARCCAASWRDDADIRASPAWTRIWRCRSTTT